MNMVELLQRLGAYPADTKVKIYGQEISRCGNDCDFFDSAYFDYNEKEGTLYIEGEPE